MKCLIVGIDPGTTTGVCALSLKGNLVRIYSKKHFSQGEVVSFLSGLGDPVIFGVDVMSAPDSVNKLNATFGAIIFTPDNEVSHLEKLELVRVFLENYEKVSLKNRHERDALAAAILAYNFFENKLKQVEKKVKEAGIGKRGLDLIKKEVLYGNSMSKSIRKFKKSI